MKIASTRGGVEQNAITLAVNVLERGVRKCINAGQERITIMSRWNPNLFLVAWPGFLPAHPQARLRLSALLYCRDLATHAIGDAGYDVLASCNGSTWTRNGLPKRFELLPPDSQFKGVTCPPLPNLAIVLGEQRK
jgi:hypothetical protein